MALNEDEQTEAVFKSSRTEVDPVSGNEVPPGSLPEEVRDDIPAMLSEGEYVVPADVLRFYGVKFFEDLRAQAKMGLAEMEANGRIGGEPIEEEGDDLPFSDEELMVEESIDDPQEEQMSAAFGGLVGYNEGGMQLEGFGSDQFQQDPNDPTQVIIGSQPGGTGYELVTYYGPNGEVVNIPFFNGMALGVIPPGYTRNAPQETAVEQVSRDDDDSTPPAAEEVTPRKTPEQMTNTDLRLNKAIMIGASFLVPGASRFMSKQIDLLNEEIDKRKETGLYERKYDDLFDKDIQGMFESDFGSKEKFKQALDYVAPKGMSWNDETQSYIRDDDDDDNGPGVILGGTKVETTDDGVDVYTPGKGTIRPKLRPDNVGSSSTTQEESKGFYESITGTKFEDTALGKALGLGDDDENDE